MEKRAEIRREEIGLRRIQKGRPCHSFCCSAFILLPFRPCLCGSLPSSSRLCGFAVPLPCLLSLPIHYVRLESLTPPSVWPPPLRMWQFLNFLPLPQGQGSLRPTRSSRLRIGSSFLIGLGAVDRGLLLAGDLAGVPGACSWMASLSTQVEPTKSSSSCSMRKIRSVTRSPTRRPHLLVGPHALALVLDLGIDLGIAPQAHAASAGDPSPAGGLSRPCRESAAPATAPCGESRGGSDLRPPSSAAARARRG